MIQMLEVVVFACMNVILDSNSRHFEIQRMKVRILIHSLQKSTSRLNLSVVINERGRSELCSLEVLLHLLGSTTHKTQHFATHKTQHFAIKMSY